MYICYGICIFKVKLDMLQVVVGLSLRAVGLYLYFFRLHCNSRLLFVDHDVKQFTASCGRL